MRKKRGPEYCIFTKIFSSIVRPKMKYILLLFFPITVFAQNYKVDTLEKKARKIKEDTTGVNILNGTVRELANIGNYDEALKYAWRARELAQKINF